MGQISKALGMGSEFKFEDKIYKLSPWNYGIQGKFEVYLEREAVGAIQRLKDLLPGTEYREQLETVVKDVAAGVYSFGTETVAKALQSLKHLKQLLLLMLTENDTSVTSELVNRMCDTKLEDVMRAMTTANLTPDEKVVDGPNAVTPAT